MKRMVQPRSINQRRYFEAIEECDMGVADGIRDEAIALTPEEVLRPARVGFLPPAWGQPCSATRDCTMY